MFELYQQRLQNLSQILQELHKIIKNDEVLHHLSDPVLEKYRIDRINQIVTDVLNSEKQRMLIKVLQKYQQISTQLKQGKQSSKQKQRQKQSQVQLSKGKTISNKQNYFESWLALKQKSQAQITKLTELLNEKNQSIQKANKQIANLKQKIKTQQKAQAVKTINVDPCISCQKLNFKLSQYQAQVKKQGQFIEKLKRDGQSAVKILNDKILALNQTKNQLQNELSKKSSLNINTRQIPQDPTYKSQNHRRTQKMQVMRRQIAFLQQQLLQIQKKFNTIKDLSLGNIIGELKKYKNIYKKLKEYINQQMIRFSQHIQSTSQKIKEQLTKSQQKNLEKFKPERLLLKINQIQNQLDYFLENQVLVQ